MRRSRRARHRRRRPPASLPPCRSRPRPCCAAAYRTQRRCSPAADLGCFTVVVGDGVMRLLLGWSVFTSLILARMHHTFCEAHAAQSIQTCAMYCWRAVCYHRLRKGTTPMPLLKLLLLRIRCRVCRHAAVPSEPLVSFRSAWRHSAGPAGLAARRGAAARGAIGDLQGVLGWALGRGSGAAARAIERAGLLVELDLVGAVALTAVAFFVVAPIKGEPIPALWPRFAVGFLLNGAWGFGTALLLRLLAGLRF